MPEQLTFVVPSGLLPAPEHRLTPAGLWEAVISARAALAQARHRPPTGSEPAARADLLEALEAYVESLDERGHPVPYTLRDELRLQRLTCMASRHPRPMTT